MAIVNQDFITYAGDSVSPIFTVLDANNNPVNISSVTGITWSAVRNLQSSAVLTKTMAAAQIALVGGGANGQFQVTILAADTVALSGWYQHTAALQGSGLSQTTVTVGRMQVGVAPNWTWDPGSVGTVDLYTVRNLIGDTIEADQQLSDQQVLWAVSTYSNVWLAAAECCRNIAAFYARQVDQVQGVLKTNYSQRAKTYTTLSIQLMQTGMSRGGASAYVGGISLSDKNTNVQNTDRTPPQFVIGMFDDLLPESPVGHQTGAGQGVAVSDDSDLGGL